MSTTQVEHNQRQRWYDQEEACTRLMDNLLAMPQPVVREFCGRMLQHFAESVRKQVQYKNASGITSIGLPGIEALYKFRRNQLRWYDQDPLIQRSVAVMYTLPPQGLSVLGYLLGDTLGLIAVYAQVCDDVGQPPSSNDLVNISRKSLQEGHKEAVKMLKDIVGEDLLSAYVGDI